MSEARKTWSAVKQTLFGGSSSSGIQEAPVEHRPPVEDVPATALTHNDTAQAQEAPVEHRPPVEDGLPEAPLAPPGIALGMLGTSALAATALAQKRASEVN